MENYTENIGKKVTKCRIKAHNRINTGIELSKKDVEYTSKPFKSGLKINTVKDVVSHPVLNVPAYTFIEDDSYVECRRCMVIE